MVMFQSIAVLNWPDYWSVGGSMSCHSQWKSRRFQWQREEEGEDNDDYETANQRKRNEETYLTLMEHLAARWRRRCFCSLHSRFDAGGQLISAVCGRAPVDLHKRRSQLQSNKLDPRDDWNVKQWTSSYLNKGWLLRREAIHRLEALLLWIRFDRLHVE